MIGVSSFKDSFTEEEALSFQKEVEYKNQIKELQELLRKYREDDARKDKFIVKLSERLHYWESGTG